MTLRFIFGCASFYFARFPCHQSLSDCLIKLFDGTNLIKILHIPKSSKPCNIGIAASDFADNGIDFLLNLTSPIILNSIHLVTVSS
jgi:hypothetical protein